MKTAAVSLTLAAVLWQTQPPALPDIYKSVHALTWVVRDVDKTVAGWQRLGFTDIRIVGDVTFADVRYFGKPATCIAKVAEGHLGDVAVQWIQTIAEQQRVFRVPGQTRRRDVQSCAPGTEPGSAPGRDRTDESAGSWHPAIRKRAGSGRYIDAYLPGYGGGGEVRAWVDLFSEC